MSVPLRRPASGVRGPEPPGDELPAEERRTPTADEWAAMTPAERLRVKEELAACPPQDPPRPGANASEGDHLLFSPAEGPAWWAQVLARRGAAEAKRADELALRAEAEAQRAEATLAVLATTVLALVTQRGIALSPSETERISACRDLSTLARWATRATEVAAAAELFSAEPGGDSPES